MFIRDPLSWQSTSIQLVDGIDDTLMMPFLRNLCFGGDEATFSLTRIIAAIL